MLSFTTSTAAHLLSQYGGIGKENDLVVSIKSFFSVIVHASLHSPCFFFSHTLYYTEISLAHWALHDHFILHRNYLSLAYWALHDHFILHKNYLSLVYWALHDHFILHRNTSPARGPGAGVLKPFHFTVSSVISPLSPTSPL